jgi:hypothetical protein
MGKIVVTEFVSLDSGAGSVCVPAPARMLTALADAVIELRRLQTRNRTLDRRPALRGIEPLVLGCGEDEVQDAALLGRELGLDQVRRPLRVRPRSPVLVAQLTPNAPTETIRRTTIPIQPAITRRGEWRTPASSAQARRSRAVRGQRGVRPYLR